MASLQNIPSELTRFNSWIVYRPIPNPSTGKIEKRPIDTDWCNTNRSIKSCLCQLADNPKLGLGFVFQPDYNGVIGIDRDNAKVDGRLCPEADGLIKNAHTFGQWSLSGNGFHLYVFGKLAENMRNKYQCNQGSVEIYSRSRFFAFPPLDRNNHIPDTPQRVSHCSNLYNLIPFLLPKTSEIKQPISEAGSESADNLAIRQIIIINLMDRLARDKNRSTFLRLIYGQWRGYKQYATQNQADLALMANVMFYAKSNDFLSINFGKGLAECDRQALAFSICNQVMLRSKLMRSKWDRLDYRISTMTLAWDSVLSTYGRQCYRSEKQRQRQVMSATSKTG